MKFSKIIGKVDPAKVKQAEEKLSSVFVELSLSYDIPLSLRSSTRLSRFASMMVRLPLLRLMVVVIIGIPISF
jgi:hypothetical protein